MKIQFNTGSRQFTPKQRAWLSMYLLLWDASVY